MYRFWAGLMIAAGCHILLFLVPIDSKQVEPSRLPQMSGITVRFNPLKPPTPRREVKVIPSPPNAIEPLEKRVEKPTPKKVSPPKPNPKPKLKPRQVKKKKTPAVKPRKQIPPSPPPKALQERSFADLQPDSVMDVQPKHDALPVTTETTVTHTPVTNITVREAYPRNEGNPPPKYPVLARRRGWEGTVELLVMVLENGQVGSISVEKSSGYAILDETALKTVSKYHFVPALQGDKTVAMQVKVPIHFRLRDEK